MADVLLNGRVPEPWEVPALEHGTRCDRDRGLDLLAGLLAEYPRTTPPDAAPPGPKPGSP